MVVGLFHICQPSSPQQTLYGRVQKYRLGGEKAKNAESGYMETVWPVIMTRMAARRGNPESWNYSHLASLYKAICQWPNLLLCIGV